MTTLPRFVAPAALVLTIACAGPAVAAPVPQPGSAADAVKLYDMQVPPLAQKGGVEIQGSAYGSSLVPKPGSDRVFYGLTDRGPNVDGPSDGVKVEPLPDYQPKIGEFELRDGHAKLMHTIGLKAPDGSAYNGLVNTDASTGETIEGLDGHELPASPNGFDPEGLVAMPDGTFWVSDEYGPFIDHFGADGTRLERLSTGNGVLPAELAEREPNKGMEGLTVTPDGTTLVGTMQAALNAPDDTGAKSKNISALRIVTVDLATHETHQYVYVLHNSDGADTTVSEIAALDDHRFLVDERDSEMEPGANKKLYEIDLRGATDVGERSTVSGATYDPAAGGLLIGGRSLEKVAGTGDTAQTTDALRTAGITPVRSREFLDLGGLMTAVDPQGGFFGGDKIEGVAPLDHGHRIVISNDSDFGLSAVTGDGPYQLVPKTLPNGKQEHGQYVGIDVDQVPARFR